MTKRFRPGYAVIGLWIGIVITLLQLHLYPGMYSMTPVARLGGNALIWSLLLTFLGFFDESDSASKHGDAK